MVEGVNGFELDLNMENLPPMHGQSSENLVFSLVSTGIWKIHLIILPHIVETWRWNQKYQECVVVSFGIWDFCRILNELDNG
jgi:hypothetical protein